MSDDMKEFRQELRITALEFMLMRLYAGLQSAGGLSNAQQAALNKDMLEYLATKAHSSMDPAMSDLVSAEFEAAVRRLLEMQAEFVEREQPGKPPPNQTA